MNVKSAKSSKITKVSSKANPYAIMQAGDKFGCAYY